MWVPPFFYLLLLLGSELSTPPPSSRSLNRSITSSMLSPVFSLEAFSSQLFSRIKDRSGLDVSTALMAPLALSIR